MSQTDVQDIIKRAIGYKEGRDEITVSSVKLGTAAPTEEPPSEEMSSLTKFAQYVNIARYATLGIALLAVIGLLGLILFRRGPAPAAAPAAQTDIPSAEAMEQLREQRRREEFEKFLEQARNDPDTVARMLEKLLAGPAPAQQ
jgi:flagellar biosynthesis/type III secretory pathway M-ring protein FliF/YscJ